MMIAQRLKMAIPKTKAVATPGLLLDHLRERRHGAMMAAILEVLAGSPSALRRVAASMPSMLLPIMASTAPLRLALTIAIVAGPGSSASWLPAMMFPKATSTAIGKQSPSASTCTRMPPSVTSTWSTGRIVNDDGWEDTAGTSRASTSSTSSSSASADGRARLADDDDCSSCHFTISFVLSALGRRSDVSRHSSNSVLRRELSRATIVFTAGTYGSSGCTRR